MAVDALATVAMLFAKFHRIGCTIDGRTMSQAEIITRARLRTLRAAAVAGILFSVLLMVIMEGLPPCRGDCQSRCEH